MSNCEHNVNWNHCRLCNTHEIRMAKDWKTQCKALRYDIVTRKIGDVVRFLAFKEGVKVGQFDLLPGADRPKSSGKLAHLGEYSRQF